MINKNADALQGDGGVPDPSLQPGKPDPVHSFGDHTVFKSGPLLLSSKGIGWTSWKKRWFILTRTSLVFFKSDPNAVPQKANEVNITLGGIDLNNSGSVVVKADKKLLTLLFPDGRDGRTVTLKAETTEDLNEWKTALESALAQAPSAANVTAQNGAIKNEQTTESKDTPLDQSKEREPMKSKVIGQPILLALEDADGAPTFLEKGLRFIEQHGVKVEGILRQAADVADVEFRVREYEQGKVEFSPEEDAHVIADCVKHVLRELPSSPVPASCCKALLEACRTDRTRRVSAMRAAICETFPEPNRRLLQRILVMMQAVASHKAENRMSSSAVAACMAPLLLRALFVGECEIENDFDVGGDGSLQLLQAAAAANHAQVIVITLLDEYDSLFGEAHVSPDMYMESVESETGSEGSEVESYDEEDEEEEEEEDEEDDDDYDDEEQDESVEGSDADEAEEEEDDEDDDIGSEASSKTGSPRGYHVPDDKDHIHLSPKSSVTSEDLKVKTVASSISHEDVKNSQNLDIPTVPASVEQSNKPSTNPTNAASCIKKSVTMANSPARDSRHGYKWGRTAARKNVSMESIEFSLEDEGGIGTLEDAKNGLHDKFAEDVKDNIHDQQKQNRRSHDRRRGIEQDVASLQEQLPEEKNSSATLEAGQKLTSIDVQTKADLEELALLEAELANLEKRVNDLRKKLNLPPRTSQDSAPNSCNKPEQSSNHETKLKNKPDTEVFGKSRSKDSQLGAENENERKLGSNHPPQTSSKRVGAKKEVVANPLTKLSFRLNFMKDKGRESAHSVSIPEKGKGSEIHQPMPSPNASRGAEAHSVSISEKGKGSEFRQPLSPPRKSRGSEVHSVSLSIPEKGKGSECRQPLSPPLRKSRGSEVLHSSVSIPEKGKGSEFRQPLASPGKSRGSEIHSVTIQEKGRGGMGSFFQMPEKGSGKEGPSEQVSDKMGKSGEASERWGQHPQHLDRGKSESHKPYNVDKGR